MLCVVSVFTSDYLISRVLCYLAKDMRIEPFRKISLYFVWPAFAFIVVFAVWMLIQHLSQPSFTNAILYPETSRSIQPFSLVDSNNQEFDKSRLLGKWSFVFFGYTHCSDICPLTLHTLNQAADLITKNFADVQFIFASVDPQRDNSVHLKNYVTHFNPDFLGISGDYQQLVAFGKALGAPFDKSDSQDSRSFIMAHSAQIFLINPKAERYALLPQPHQAGEIVHDFYTIRSSYYEPEAL